MTPDDELDLIETEDLLRALDRRFSATVFVGLEDLDKLSYNRIDHYSGGSIIGIGLCRFMENKLLLEETSRPEPEEG